jgi:hypothetical protein
VNGLNLQTETVLPGFFDVNGAATQAIETTGGELSGTRVFVSGGESGIRTHRVFTPDLFIDGVGFLDLTATFIPPILFPLSFCIGDVIEHDGTVLFEFSDDTAFTSNVSETRRPTSLEEITVPFGTFETLKFQEVSRFFGTVGGTPIETIATAVVWNEGGLGTVRSEVSLDGETDVAVLVDTNRTPVPEPSPLILGLSALAALAGLRGATQRTLNPS